MRVIQIRTMLRTTTPRGHDQPFVNTMPESERVWESVKPCHARRNDGARAATGDSGRVEIYDPSRSGRSRRFRGRPDALGFTSAYHRFEQNGWELHFLPVERTGNQPADVSGDLCLRRGIDSENPSDNASRGRREETWKGAGGPVAPPLGHKADGCSHRPNSRSGRKITPGGGGTILVPVPEILSHWEAAAKRAGRCFLRRHR